MTNETKFICDRMAGTLCRYLRLMGYDTLSANDLPAGNKKEDTILLQTARNEKRIILTRDAELSRRDTAFVKYLSGRTVPEQISWLIKTGLISPELRLTRCSLCNNPLIPFPESLKKGGEDRDFTNPDEIVIRWCTICKKAYWEGSHTRNMRHMLTTLTEGDREINR